MRWYAQLLGGFALTRPAQTLTRFRTRKTAALLAYLAFHRDVGATRERLIDLLWPDADLDAGRDSLSTALAALRRQLEPPDIPRGSVLIADRERVSLNPEAVETDVADFEAALRAAPETLPFPAQLRALTRAFDLYQGVLLPDHDDAWVEPQRQRLRELYQTVVRRLLAVLTEDTRLNEAITVAQRAVKIAPESEAAHRHLLEALLRAGDLALFDQHYAAYQRAAGRGDGPETSERIEVLARTARALSRTPTPTLNVAESAVMSGRGLSCLARVLKASGQPDLLTFAEPSALIDWLLVQAPPAPARIALGLGMAEAEGTLTALDALAEAAHDGQALCTESLASLLRDSGDARLRLVRLGLYRLRPDAAGQMLYQVERADGPAQPFPPPRALPGMAHTLPPYLTRYYGREPEREAVVARLRASETRLLVITGIGGVGKTRFAVELARAFIATDSVLFVPMREVAYVEFIPDMILEHLPGVDFTVPSAHAAIAALLDRGRALLLLDSFEHLVEGGNLYLERLLAAAPGLRLIVTSRRRLGIPGESVVALDPLPTADLPDDLPDLARHPAVALFVDRAQAARPDFQLTPANRHAIATLCTRLDGLPLAIELAAARAGVYTPAQMLDQLDQRFAFLVGRTARPDDPHRALSVVLEWSYALLDEAARTAFVRLSVFRGSWDLPAAAAICALSNAADDHDELYSHSLLRASETPSGMRFQMLDTVRDFAESRLSEAERDSLAAAHTGHYRALAARLAQQPDAPDALEAEIDNFRAVMWRTLEGDIDAYLAVAAGLLPLWAGRAAYQREGRHWLEQGLRYVEVASARPSPEIHEVARRALDQLSNVVAIGGSNGGA